MVSLKCRWPAVCCQQFNIKTICVKISNSWPKSSCLGSRTQISYNVLPATPKGSVLAACCSNCCGSTEAACSSWVFTRLAENIQRMSPGMRIQWHGKRTWKELASLAGNYAHPVGAPKLQPHVRSIYIFRLDKVLLATVNTKTKNCRFQMEFCKWSMPPINFEILEFPLWKIPRGFRNTTHSSSRS